MPPHNAASFRPSAKKVTKQNQVESEETSLSKRWMKSSGEEYDETILVKAGQKGEPSGKTMRKKAIS